MRRGGEFRGVAIATVALQNVMRRSSTPDFHGLVHLVSYPGVIA
jgi:hypothetical protein